MIFLKGKQIGWRRALIASAAVVTALFVVTALAASATWREGSKRVGSARRAKVTTTTSTTTSSTTTTSTTTTSTTTTTAPTTTAAPATTAAKPAPPPPPPTAAPPVTNGPTFYVSLSGNDANPGTLAAPWRSLSGSIGRLNAGETLVVRGGRYNAAQDEQFNIDGKNGNPNAWTTIMAYPGERPVIQLNSFWQGFFVNNSSYVQIRGFEVIGTANTDQRFTDGIEMKSSHHVRVTGNVVHDTGGCGVCSIDSNHISIEGNEIYGTSKWNPYQTSGISFFTSANIGGGNNGDGFSMYITGNRVHHVTTITRPSSGPVTDGNCIIIDYGDTHGYAGSTLIQNNLCYENGGRGVESTHSRNIVAVNNTLVNNLRHPDVDGGEMTAAFSTNLTFRNNLASPSRPGKGYVNWDSSNVALDHNVYVGQPPEATGAGDQVVPAAINGDYTLMAGSPAINAGAVALAPSVDIRGTNRIGLPDVGAYEAG